MQRDKRSFEAVLSDIEDAEKDKDRFLKAARLQRHEADHKYRIERLTLLLNYLIIILAMLGGLGLAFFFLYSIAQ